MAVATTLIAFVPAAVAESGNTTTLQGGTQVTLGDRQRISADGAAFQGWPTVHRADNGTLYIAYSGGREGHGGPFSRVELIRSTDGGQNWSSPLIVVDTPLDDRDSSVLQTAEGTLLVTWFTSLKWLDRLKQIEAAWTDADDAADKPKDVGYFFPPFTRDTLERWQAKRDALPAEHEGDHMQGWMVRSEDGGQTWSEPYRVPVHSPHGPVRLADDRLLFLGKRDGAGHAYESADDGRTWQHLGQIPAREGDRTALYHEYHGIEAADGRLVAQLRNHNEQDEHIVLQSVSRDGGRTWSEPESTEAWGFPTHLLKLDDGRLVMTYGDRRQDARAIRVRLSDDHGETWSDEVALYDKGTHWDLGYPSTVSLGDGRLLSVWYEASEEEPYKARLYQRVWTISR